MFISRRWKRLRAASQTAADRADVSTRQLSRRGLVCCGYLLIGKCRYSLIGECQSHRPKAGLRMWLMSTPTPPTLRLSISTWCRCAAGWASPSAIPSCAARSTRRDRPAPPTRWSSSWRTRRCADGRSPTPSRADMGQPAPCTAHRWVVVDRGVDRRNRMTRPPRRAAPHPVWRAAHRPPAPPASRRCPACRTDSRRRSSDRPDTGHAPQKLNRLAEHPRPAGSAVRDVSDGSVRAGGLDVGRLDDTRRVVEQDPQRRGRGSRRREGRRQRRQHTTDSQDGRRGGGALQYVTPRNRH